MPQKKENKQISIGTILSYTALAINSLINLLLTPTIIAKIGDGQYGVYKTILALISYLSVCKLGFGSAAVRYIAEYRLTGKKDKEQEFLTVIKWLNLFACILVVIVGIILYHYIPQLFSESFTIEEIHLASQLFILLIISVVISVLNDIYDAIVTGYEEFIFQKITDIMRSIIRVMLIITVLVVNPMALWLTVIDVVINGMLLLMNYIKSKQLNVTTTYLFRDIKQVNLGYYKEVIIFSFYVLLNSLINQMIWSTDSIIIGMRLNSYQASVYSVGSNISSLFYTTSTIVSSLLLPKAVKLVEGKCNPKDITQFFVETARFQSVIIFGILGAYCVLGKQFIMLWMGNGYANAWISSLLVMIGSVFASLVVSGHAILKAQNRQTYFMIVYFCIFLINVVTTYWIVPSYGINGAALMTCISFVIGSIFFIWPYYQIKIKINMFEFLRNIWKIAAIFIFIVLVGYITTKQLVISSWSAFFTCCIIYCVIYFTFIWFLYLDKNEKKSIFGRNK